MSKPNTTHTPLPELLMPAGNFDAFKAAIAGGADAVYLGIKNFNARGRAQNFTWQQLATALATAHKNNAKVYVTLNTVIKNNEITELIDTLNTLSQLKPDAIIIQDWGVYYIAKKFFPNLALHASTQMGIHNSQGAIFGQHKGFERVILARELTLKEVGAIKAKSKVEIEMFVHGALCYSFSGMCMYSSFIGGQGANRGLCKQPCRRIYHTGKNSIFPFNLKDFQALDVIPEIKKMGVHSLKVEGRLKSINYVYQVAQAYKMVLHDENKLDEAREMLKMDMGRDKTSYFLGGTVTDAITNRTATGFALGQVAGVTNNTVTINAGIELQKGDRIRVVHTDGTQTAFKIQEFTHHESSYTVEKPEEGLFAIGDKAFLASRKDIKTGQIEEVNIKPQLTPIDKELTKRIGNDIGGNNKKSKGKKVPHLFVRINDLEWIKKVQFQDIEGLYIQLPVEKYARLKLDVPFVKKNINKIYVELPAFIPEQNIAKWHKTISALRKKGINRFVISHLSQKMFFSKGDFVVANENVYTFNDAAISMLKQEGVKGWTYPLESDMENLQAYRFKEGMVPVYFRPRLFFSRMPANAEQHTQLTDDHKIELEYSKHDNLNYIYPQDPVSFTHHMNTFVEMGFMRFLADFSFEKASSNRWKTVVKRIKSSEQIQPAFSFNIKSGLV
ncbi:MAG: peptidase U32 family protein [Salinivirgaceae bacterium]